MKLFFQTFDKCSVNLWYFKKTNMVSPINFPKLLPGNTFLTADKKGFWVYGGGGGGRGGGGEGRFHLLMFLQSLEHLSAKDSIVGYFWPVEKH